MSKRKAHQKRKSVPHQPPRLTKPIVGLALVLGLLVAGGVMAQWGSLGNTTRMRPMVLAQAQPSPTLSKEYIYAGGRLLATEEPTAATSSTGVENVIWTNVVGATASGNNLTKNSNVPTDWGNSGAVSVQTIASGDGYMEFKAIDANTHRMCGLSNGDSTQSWNDIDFAIYLQGDGSLTIYEAGINRGTFGTYAAGNTFRVAVEGGAVKYYKDGILFYTSGVTPTYPLLVDTALYNSGASVNNAVIASTPPPTGGGVENLVWTNIVGATASGNSLTKPAATGWGNSGAVSVQTIASGDGYMEFKATEANTHRMCGLSNGDSTQSWDDIDFAIYLRGDGILAIYEAGTDRGTFGTYAAGNTFRVAVEGGAVKYYKEGTLFYSSTVAPTYPLLVDTALYTNNASIDNAVIARALPSANVTWTNVIGATASGNSLTKTAATGWGNSGASSTKALASGDGYVEFKATEANTHRMCGLSNGDSTQSWNDIDFAIYLQGDGSLTIYEAGINRGTFGTYAAGNTFRVAIEGGMIKYYKNGAVFYSHNVTPTYPLLVDTALYSEGSTITNALLSGTLTP